jgi:uncharacterized membrane protein YeaQ/YmgE (transglycosylase-associated protein family)
MPSKHKSRINIWIGGVAGFLLGVCGNLLATWIQQDLLANSFTPLRISLIILCSILGTLVIVVSDTSKNTLRTKEKTTNDKGKNFYSRIRLAWSKFRTRGKGIHAEDISAVGSDIDIDTK